MYRLAVSLLALASTGYAADCLRDQERQHSKPSGEQIAKAVGSQSDLEIICAGNWRLNDEEKLTISYNHWSIIYTVKRDDNTKPMRHCMDAFHNIIDQCVSNGNYWGGSWSYEGETYSISNRVSPENGLAPSDEGGPAVESGPITAAPEPSASATAFATTTATIEGLTTHSETTTTAGDHATVLPIWFVAAGVGIILIPGPGVLPGVLVPPPPGLPPLTIGPDGKAHIDVDGDGGADDDNDDDDEGSSTATEPCTVCASCADFDILSDDATATLENDGDPDLPTIDPAIWSAMETKYPLPTKPADPSPPADTPTQSAAPIDQPACVDANDAVKEDLSRWTTRGTAIWLGGSAISVNELLWKIRQTVCDGTCKAPDGVDSKYVAVYQSNGACEVSIAVSSEIVVYVNSDMWPENNKDFGTIWQQCWDSIGNIIDKCVDNSAKSGWWNGDHVYQFYKAGVRQLNDPDAHHTKNNINIDSYLMPPTDGLSCGKDCQGFIPNPQWCQDNCGAKRFARGRRWASSSNNPGSAPVLFARATETVNTVGGCNLKYVLPDYPSSGTAENNAAVKKFYDRDDTNNGNGNNCDNPVLTGPVAKVNGHSYDTEHVYEKHIIKRFLFYLVGGQQAFNDSIDPDGADPVSTCSDVEAVFNQRNKQGKYFKNETAAQQLGRAVSCSGTQCPDNNRASEMFLLRKEVNGIKNRIFAGHYTGVGRDANDNKLPSCNPARKTYVEMQQQMINAAMVFQYMNKQETFDAFNAVHLRIRQILTNLDADALGTNTPPRNLAPYIREGVAPTWLAAYDEFMNRFLVDTERKMGLWQRECRES
ncbi:hypothetical protein D7B24_003364 [Verticillium nonalfalfae]|uniref:Uncharacterized protein n=1 Tax=Verticillium nonalfalfae TaxID=1051616 RepID=A0A3M9XY30_9PEZI|nr:hypothetical protein D7B24_003364 [Verticillium nonalfalfae]